MDARAIVLNPLKDLLQCARAGSLGMLCRMLQKEPQLIEQDQYVGERPLIPAIVRCQCLQKGLS